MAQITSRFIAEDAVDGSKLRLANDQALRSRNAADSADVDLLKLNSSDLLEILTALGADLDAGSFKVTNLADPTAPQDAATKAYVDGVATGLIVKASVLAATTAPGTLATDFEDGDTLDGVTLSTGDRILIKDQADAAENGIYVVAASGAPTRATDMDTWAEVPAAFTFVEEGTVNADKGFVCTSDQGGTIGTTDITFTQFSSAGSYTADGQGIELVGNEFQLELDGGTLSKSASGLKVAVGGITNTEVSAGAAIVYSKLSLTNSIVNADIAAAAAIAYSKLALTNSIVNADIATGAAIARTKLASGTAYRILANDAAGVMSENAALTAARAIQSDANGQLEVSTTTATELGYVSGVTSAIQTQIDSKVAKAGDTMTGDLEFEDQKGIVLMELTASGSDSVTVTAPDDVDGSYTLRLPVDEGTAGQVLSTDGMNPAQLSWVSTSTYTDEDAQDAVGGILVDSATIDFTYNDGVPSITAIVIAGSITDTHLATDSVTSIKIAADAVTAAKLNPDTAGTGLIQEGSGALAVDAARYSITLNGTDITNQYVDITATEKLITASATLFVDGGITQRYGVDYDIDNSGAQSRIRFDSTNLPSSDLATGGAAALIAGDILYVQGIRI